MLGHRGKTWLSASIWLLIIAAALWPAAALATMPAPNAFPAPFLVVSTQTSLEAQIMGERPAPAASLTCPANLPETTPGSEASGNAALQLPKNFRISFRYNSENPVSGAERFTQPPLLFKYSMDYCLSSKFKVGLSGFLYQSPADQLNLLRQKNDLYLGWGPSVKYDLGRWSFTFQGQVSQMDNKARPDESKDLQSWFRVWYAF